MLSTPHKMTGREIVVFLGGITLLCLTLLHGASFQPPFGDSDTYTRIAWLREVGLSGILDPLWRRDGAPDGMLLEWTLPFNLVALGLGSLLGWDMAARVAGPLSLLVLGATCAWGAYLLGARRAWVAVPGLLALATVALAYAQDGRLNHHVLTATCGLLCVVLALRWWRRPVEWRAAAVGAAVGLAFWHGMETIPMGLAAWGIMVWGVLAYPRRSGSPWQGFLAGGGFVLAMGLLIDGPWPHFHPLTAHRLSLFHLCVFVGMTVSLGCAADARQRSKGAGVRAALTPAIFAFASLAGPLTVAWASVPRPAYDPLFDSYFWSLVGELASVVSHPMFVAVELAFPYIVLIAWVASATRVRLLSVRTALSLVLFGAVLMGMVYLRMVIYPQILSVLLAAGGCEVLLRRTDRAGLVRYLMPGVIALGCVAILTGLTLNRGRVVASSECRATPALGAWLEASLPSLPVVLADVWISPALLGSTQALRVVGGPYHGNPRGVEDVARVMTATDDGVALAVLRDREASLVAVCAAPWMAAALSDTDQSLRARLSRSTPIVPAWLEPLSEAGRPANEAVGLRFWRVRMPLSSPHIPAE